MARFKSRQPVTPDPPMLIVARSTASDKISVQIEKGKSLFAKRFTSPDEIDAARVEFTKWDSYNAELLTRMFSNASIADEYVHVGARIGYINPSFGERVDSYQFDVRLKITRLEAILGRLELIPEANQPVALAQLTPSADSTPRVFIVHGHDDAAKESVARFLDKLSLGPVILHEQPNAGRTLIEKFIDNSNVSFAVIIMTPDDVGASTTNTDKLEPRARQNVIFELGYFVGLLGRHRVCALLKSGVVPPSDWDGVAYIAMDDAGAWKMLLAKEMKQAGLTVDMNQAL